MRTAEGLRRSSSSTDETSRFAIPRAQAGLLDHVFFGRGWMAERFERHRQPWTSDELQKLHTLAKKGMPLKAMAKALTRSEESIKDRAKLDGLKIAKLR